MITIERIDAMAHNQTEFSIEFACYHTKIFHSHHHLVDFLQNQIFAVFDVDKMEFIDDTNFVKLADNFPKHMQKLIAEFEPAHTHHINLKKGKLNFTDAIIFISQ